jgi:kynurenine 3-monooxygenase
MTICFDDKVTDCNLQSKMLTTAGNQKASFDLVVGCDGVNSVVREAIKTSAGDKFDYTKTNLPGEFKVCRLPMVPPKVDTTSVCLLLPQKGSATAFIEPTADGSCILFASSNKEDPIIHPVSIENATTALQEAFPLLNGIDLAEIANQLTNQKTGSASSVKCNIYHYPSCAALCGDAAHATGGVSGQGVNSALMDAKVLADCLAEFFQASQSGKDKKQLLQKALLSYSQQQVPEGLALYDLSFGPNPKGLWPKLRYGVKNVLDTLFQGKLLGIGQPPLQTLLTTTLTSFSQIRQDRAMYYEEEFADPATFNAKLMQVYGEDSSNS